MIIIQKYLELYRNIVKKYQLIPAINDNGAIVDFDGTNATNSFNFKTKVTGQTANYNKNNNNNNNNNNVNIVGRVDVEIMVR